MHYSKMKKMMGILLAGACTMNLCGCSSTDVTSDSEPGTTQANLTDSSGTEDTDTTAEIVELTLEEFLGDSEMFHNKEKEIGYEERETSLIVFSETGVSCSDSTVQLLKEDKTQVVINQEGTYCLQGESSNAQVVVNAPDKDVLLILDGVRLTNDSDAVLYVEEAGEVYLTLAEDTENVFDTTGEFSNENESVDSVIYSKSDLTMNGNGTLEVATQYGHGVVSKDDLKVTGGNYRIETSGHCLVGKDSVRICDGDFTLSSSRDGIHADHDEDAEKGYIYITGGTCQIQSADDGMDATGHIVVTGGTFNIASEDDAVHGSRSMLVEGGSFEIQAEDDGIHVDGNLKINEGIINIAKSYEGLEGNTIDINGGQIDIRSSDDGMNAASASSNEEGTQDFGKDDSMWQKPGNMEGTPKQDGNSDEGNPPAPDEVTDDSKRPAPDEVTDDSQRPALGEIPDGASAEFDRTASDGAIRHRGEGDPSGMKDGFKDGTNRGMHDGAGGGKGGGFDSDASCVICITGGKVIVIAQGDGIDSNGTLEITGGEIYVSGPDNSGNGALDYGISGTISGGTIVAAGAAGMAESFSSDSAQAFITQSVSGNAGDKVILQDKSGTELLSYTPTKAYANLVISCPEMEKGEVYTLTVGSQTVEVQP